MNTTHLIHHFTRSSTWMSWGNLAAKSGSFVLLLPLALTQLPHIESTLYLLFMAVAALLIVLDLGFSPTFTRLYAIATSGVAIEQLNSEPAADNAWPRAATEPDGRMISALAQLSANIYFGLGISAIALISVTVSPSVIQLTQQSANANQNLAAWIVVLIGLPLNLLLLQYGAIAQGLGFVARWQRRQMLFSLGGIAATALSLWMFKALLPATATLLLVNLVNVTLAKVTTTSLLREVGGDQPIAEDERRLIWKMVWPAAWRAGVGALFSAGIIQGSGVLVTHMYSMEIAAQYLLALQLIRGISSFCQAPFYSKIPVFATLYARGEHAQLLRAAGRAMQLSYFVFLTGFIALGFIGDPLFALIGAQPKFPSQTLWTLLGLAFLAERYGAMHIQLYSLSHRINWHIANGVNGLLMLLLTWAFHRSMGEHAFALAMLLAYLGFYCWYAAVHSYRLYRISAWSFERSRAAPAMLVAVAYAVIRLAGV